MFFFLHIIFNDTQTNLLQAVIRSLSLARSISQASSIHGSFCSFGVYFLTVVLSKTTILLNNFIKIRHVTD